MKELVSVVVVTYNSSEFVIETLESIKEQSYKNLELIISDDNSKDDTILKVNQWLAINKEHFTSSKLITSDINKGTTFNCNRGLKEVAGQYTKFIAGDDILTKDCIEKNLTFAKENKANFVFSDVRVFKVVKDEKQYLNTLMTSEDIDFFTKASKEQYDFLLKRNYIAAPSAFMKTEALKDLGGFNEEFKFFEDYPLWLQATLNGHKLYYLNEVTVYYRLSENSISNECDERYCNVNLLNERIHFYEKYRRPFLIRNLNYLWTIHNDIEFYKCKTIVKRGNNKKNYTIDLKLLKMLDVITLLNTIRKR